MSELKPKAKPFCFVVDDEQGIRRIVSFTLREFGISCSEFEDACGVMMDFDKRTPDLVFLDVSLNGSDAIDVIRTLGDKGYRGAVQLMSGKDPSLLEEIRRVGERHALHMLPVIQKPFRPDAIRAAVKNHFSQLHALQEKAPPVAAGIPVTPEWASLDEILDRGWLEVWYQPKIDLKQKYLCGAEGLARARHPEQGIIPPGAFIPNASEDALLRLSEKVILKALRDWNAFCDQGFPLKLAVNVPVAALVKMPISNIVRENRPKSEKWPGLILEITEDQIVRDIQLAHEVATQLKIYDIELSIDDFGTGYSHLARLRELPFGELKLDRNMVMNCGEDSTNTALCQTTIDLAHRFGSKAVAEGIEKASELEALYKMGCDIGQGFLLAPPMTQDRFIGLLKSRSTRRAPANA
jgi:EAL domain-containing protein (putative c-di-GMP-specific phosphodiesterase class I)/FixJ family two-component response regulator